MRWHQMQGKATLVACLCFCAMNAIGCVNVLVGRVVGVKDGAWRRGLAFWGGEARGVGMGMSRDILWYMERRSLLRKARKEG